MRTITTLISSCFFLFLVSSCSKEVLVETVPQTSSAKEISGSLMSLAGDTTTLSLQPGPQDGQDCYVNFLAGNSAYASSNFNYDPELSISAWTVNGAQLKQRGYIKFTGLNALPAGAHVLSAELYLYGLNPNTSLSAPQGNSIYPGSPYNSSPNNGLYISLVTGGDWSEDSLTWNNKPVFYPTNFDGIIPSSTSQWNYNAIANVTDLTKAIVKSKRNYGFCIHLQDEEIYRCMLFASSEASNAAMRPKLVVKYAM